MPLDMEAVKELKQKLKLAKTKPLNFALALGKKPEDCALLIHKEQGGDKLIVKVKKEPGVQPQKSCHGILAVDGQQLKLTCKSDPPPGLKKNFKEFFRSNKILLKLDILTPDGSPFEAEPEDAPAQEAQEAQAAQTSAPQDTPDPQEEAPQESLQQAADKGPLDALEAQLAALQEEIAALADSPLIAKLQAGVQKAEALLKAEAEAKLEALLAQLSKAVKQVASIPAAPPPPPPPDPAAKGDATGEKPDPLAERWQVTAAKLEPHVARALKSGKGDPDKIRAVWAYAQGKAEAGDFAAALKSVGPLSTLLSQAAEAEKTAAQEEVAKGDDTRQKLEAWEAIKAKLAPLVAAVIKAKDGRSAKVGAAWEMAEKAASTGDLDTAMKIAGRLRPVLEEGAAGAANKAGDKGDRAPSDDPARNKALDKLDEVKGQLTRVDGLITAFGTPHPAAWDLPMQSATKMLAVDPDKEIAEIEAAAREAEALLADLEPKVKQLSLDKQNWEQQHPLFAARLVPIQAHALKDVEPIKTKLKAMEDEVKAAEAEAAKFEFQKAAGGIISFLSRGDALEAMADDCAHYRKIQASRQGLVDPNRGFATARVPVQAAVDALIKAYDDAVTRAGEEKFEEAVRLLNTVPALFDKARLLLDRSRTVDSLLVKVRDGLTTLNGLPAGVKALLDAGIKRVQAGYDASQPGTEPDVVKAAEKLTLARRECDSLLARGAVAKGYVTLRETFDTQLRDFKAHAGHEGIEDVITRMEADSASAASDAILRKFDSATRILKTTQGDWPAYKTRADDYLAYKQKKDAVEARLKELRKHDQASEATQELALCDGHMREAATQAAARDYKSALDSATAADAAADVVKELLDMRAKMAELKKDDVLAAVDKDVVAAFKNYEELASYVEGKDDGTFASLRAAAAAEAQKGKDASTGSEPDLDKVRGHLGDAIKKLEGVVAQIASKAAFTSQRAAIRPAVETELPTGSTANDTCLSTDLPPITQLLTEADAAVQAPGLDFVAGLAKVTEALKKVQEARKKLALYIEAKAIKGKLDDAERRLKRSRDKALTYTNPIDAKESLQIEIDKVVGYRTAFDTDWGAGKHKAAVATLKADVKRAQAFEGQRADYVEAIRRRQKWIYEDEVNIAGDPLVEKERQEIAAAKVKIANLLQQRAFKSAGKVANDDSFAIDRGKAVLAARTAYEPKRAAAEAKVQEMETECAKVPGHAALADRARALRTRYDAAVAETVVAKRRFAYAQGEMEALTPECQPVIDDAKAAQAFETAREAAFEKIKEVKDHEHAGVITPLITRLEGKYANAVDLAAKGHMNQAKALVDVLPQDCADALTAAKNNAALAAIGKDLETVDEGDTAAITTAVEKLREVFDDLRWEGEAEYAASLAAAEQQVEAVEAQLQSDPKAAKAALPAALKACEALQVEIDHHKQLSELATRVTARITGVTAPFEKYALIKEEAEALKAAVAEALKSARSGGDLTAASTAIEEVMTKHHALMVMARRHDQVMLDRTALEAQHKTLLGSEYRYAIREDLEALDGELVQAGTTAEARNHDAAETHIKQAKAHAVDAVAKEKMAGNQPPDPKNIKAILDRPGGDKQLDEMIKGLDATAQRKVLRVAFEAKYGCKLNIYAAAVDDDAARQAAGNLVADGSKKGPNIRRLYEVMSVLPPQDTRGNDSLKIFGYEDVADQKGSYYSGTSKEIVMREGDATLSSVYGFGRPHEVGEVDDNCKPADEEQVDFFSWNTLHEAGHAVDDQRSFMSGVTGNSKYGGWQEHGGNVKPVAEAIADHYKYDRNYTAQYLGGNGNPPVPECPADVDPVEWERRRSKVVAHVDLAREGNNPWQSAAIAAKLNIGGRVYHESYKGGTWNSYEFAARKQAITGYQFRAPGEWFSELYAAYHSKKLKDQHPAMDWLKDLD